MNRAWLLAGGLLLLALVAPLEACSLCEGSSIVQSLTLRQEAAMAPARLILHGTIANPSLGEDGKGKTDFVLNTTLREGKNVPAPKKLVLTRYLPVDDPKNPPHYLLFCDVDGKKIDPYRGIPIKGGAKTVTYVKKALALDPKKTADNLAFFFAHLDDADPEVSRDAFLEFAKASDADILKAAPKLSASKLRQWMKDEKTPPARIGVYALLLGACGKKEDGEYLRELLDSKQERYQNAIDGIMVGYIAFQPKQGWAHLQATLADGRKPVLTRIAMLRTVRFFHLGQPKESRENVVKSMRTVLDQGELADLACEDLRRWEIWDLTDEVLKNYGKKGFDAPLVKRAIIRYALCCKPTEASKKFLAERRKDEGEIVDEVAEYLKLEKAK